MEKKIDSKVQNLFTQIEEGIREVYASKRWEEYLTAASLFHQYSPRNIMLILRAKPEATRVAGFKTWNLLERRVKKGEKGIPILVPYEYKIQKIRDKKDEKGNVILDGTGDPVKEQYASPQIRFRIGYVFDIGQTEGKEVPTIAKPLQGSVDDFQKVYQTLKQISPYPISFQNIEGSANGYCDFDNQEIVIRQGLSDLQTIKTFVHEIAHALIHQNNYGSDMPSKRRREVEAESVAYAVCSHLGLDTSNYSFEYIASWASKLDISKLNEVLNNISHQTAGLIQRIDQQLETVEVEKPKHQEQEAATLQVMLSRAGKKAIETNKQEKGQEAHQNESIFQ